MQQTVVVLSMMIMLVAACSPGPPDVSLGGAGNPSAAPSAPTVPAATGEGGGDVAWRHLATAEGVLGGSAAAAAIESAVDLKAAWERYGLSDSAPDVDFERSFVLLLGQPDDACVDELIGLEVRDGALKVRWLPPPGGCDQPLILRIHAVEVDRRHVPARFDVAFPEPYEQHAERVTIRVAAVDGEAPPPPAPPTAMRAEDLDAVFAGHEVRRCSKADERLVDAPVDGPLSDDPKIAKAQRGRAGFGVASDEASTREAFAKPGGIEDLGFPLTEAEWRQDTQASALLDDVRRWLRKQGYRPDADFVPFVSRRDGIRPGVWVDGGTTAQVEGLLANEFGAGAVDVEENPYDFEAINKAQHDLGAIMGGDGPGSIVSSAGIPGPVEIGVIDPTRETLDLIAETVDPALVCVSPALSGVAAD